MGNSKHWRADFFGPALVVQRRLLNGYAHTILLWLVGWPYHCTSESIKRRWRDDDDDDFNDIDDDDDDADNDAGQTENRRPQNLPTSQTGNAAKGETTIDNVPAIRSAPCVFTCLTRNDHQMHMEQVITPAHSVWTLITGRSCCCCEGNWCCCCCWCPSHSNAAASLPTHANTDATDVNTAYKCRHIWPCTYCTYMWRSTCICQTRRLTFDATRGGRWMTSLMFGYPGQKSPHTPHPPISVNHLQAAERKPIDSSLPQRHGSLSEWITHYFNQIGDAAP